MCIVFCCRTCYGVGWLVFHLPIFALILCERNSSGSLFTNLFDDVKMYSAWSENVHAICFIIPRLCLDTFSTF